VPRTGNYPRILPDGSEIDRLRNLPAGERPTYEAIGSQYGVSRQSVQKAHKKWLAEKAERAAMVEVEVPAQTG